MRNFLCKHFSDLRFAFLLLDWTFDTCFEYNKRRDSGFHLVLDTRSLDTMELATGSFLDSLFGERSLLSRVFKTSFDANSPKTTINSQSIQFKIRKYLESSKIRLKIQKYQQQKTKISTTTKKQSQQQQQQQQQQQKQQQQKPNMAQHDSSASSSSTSDYGGFIIGATALSTGFDSLPSSEAEAEATMRCQQVLDALMTVEENNNELLYQARQREVQNIEEAAQAEADAEAEAEAEAAAEADSETPSTNSQSIDAEDASSGSLTDSSRLRLYGENLDELPSEEEDWNEEVDGVGEPETESSEEDWNAEVDGVVEDRGMMEGGSARTGHFHYSRCQRVRLDLMAGPNVLRNLRLVGEAMARAAAAAAVAAAVPSEDSNSNDSD